MTPQQQLSQFLTQTYPPGTQNIDISITYQQKIGPTGCKVLTENLCWDIESLNVNMYFIEDDGMQELIRGGGRWKGLGVLVAERNSIGDQGVRGIGSAGWKNMKKINLNKNNIKAKGFSYLLQAQWPLLESFQLSHSQIGPQGALLFPSLKWPNLQILNLNYNMIGCEGIRQLSKCNLIQLRMLQLSNNKLYAKSMIYLSEMELPNLKHLTLNRNLIGRDKGILSEIGCIYLARLKVQGLKSIRLFANDITLNGIKEIMYSGKLAENCFLEIIRNFFTFSDIETDIQICNLFSNQF